MKSANTDRDFGIVYPGMGWDSPRFKEVRHRAKEAMERYRKAKKKKSEPLPCYEIDDEVVVYADNYNGKTRQYLLVKIIDWKEPKNKKRVNSFSYYAVVLKSTTPHFEKLGRIIEFWETSGFAGCFSGYGSWSVANVPADSIKWPELSRPCPTQESTP